MMPLQWRKRCCHTAEEEAGLLFSPGDFALASVRTNNHQVAHLNSDYSVFTYWHFPLLRIFFKDKCAQSAYSLLCGEYVIPFLWEKKKRVHNICICFWFLPCDAFFLSSYCPSLLFFLSYTIYSSLFLLLLIIVLFSIWLLVFLHLVFFLLVLTHLRQDSLEFALTANSVSKGAI